MGGPLQPVCLRSHALPFSSGVSWHWQLPSISLQITNACYDNNSGEQTRALPEPACKLHVQLFLSTRTGRTKGEGVREHQNNNEDCKHPFLALLCSIASWGPVISATTTSNRCTGLIYQITVCRSGCMLHVAYHLLVDIENASMRECKTPASPKECSHPF